MRNYNNQCKDIRETFIENDRTNLSAYVEPNAMQNKFVSAIKAARRQKEMKLQKKQSKEIQQKKLADIENQILNGVKGRNMMRSGELSESEAS